MEIQKRQIVKSRIAQSNAVIFGRYNYSKFEGCVLALALSQIEKDDDDFRVYKVYISDIKSILGLKNVSHLYSQKKIQPVLKKFKSKTVEIHSLVDGRKKIEHLGAINSIAYTEGDGFFEIEFDRKMKPHYLQLKERGNFTITVAGVLLMTSDYSKRIYHWLKSHKGKGRKEFLLSIEEMRWMLAIDNKYPAYKDFKRRVILPAQEETKETMDLTFEFEEIKYGRKVSDILFKIKDNPTGVIVSMQKESTYKNPLYLRLVSYGLNEEDAFKVMSDHEEWYILENLDEVERRKKNTDIKIKSIRSYVLDAIKNDYALATREISKKKQEIKEREKEDLDLKKKEQTFTKEEKESYRSVIVLEIEKLNLDLSSELVLFKKDPKNQDRLKLYSRTSDEEFISNLKKSSNRFFFAYLSGKYLPDEFHTFENWKASQTV